MWYDLAVVDGLFTNSTTIVADLISFSAKQQNTQHIEQYSGFTL